jgi:hypothetical protein
VYTHNLGAAGFEPTCRQATVVFKTTAFNRSAKLPIKVQLITVKHTLNLVGVGVEPTTLEYESTDLPLIYPTNFLTSVNLVLYYVP